ncbi:hypothetical protein DsansV1_C20g0165601 [Dioscorea sansibarensis]
MDPKIVGLRRCSSEPVKVRRYTLPRFSKRAWPLMIAMHCW